MRTAGLLVVGFLAGCPARPAPPRQVPDEPAPGDTLPPPQLSPALPPLRTLALPTEVACPRADASLPDQPPPDAALLAAILETPWCFPTTNGMRKLTFAADGSLRLNEHDEDDQRRNTYAQCWALVGGELAISSVRGAWDVWHVNYYDQAHGGYPTLEFRNQPHAPCRPPPPREWED